MLTPAERNKVELSIVEMLADRVGDKLADRTGQHHAPPWKPDQQVRIGVLRPILQDAPDSEGQDQVPAGDDAVAPEEAQEARPEAPPLESTGVIGLDAVVDLAEGGDLVVEVSAAVSIYLPVYATFAQARDRQKAVSEAEEALEQAAAPEDEADSGGGQPAGDASTGGATPVAATPATPAPTEGPSTEPAAPAEQPRRRRAGLPVWDAWHRTRIEVTGLRATVATDGTETEVGHHLRAAINDAIDAHFTNPDAARPFTTATRTVPLTALESETAYKQALHDNADFAWAPSHIDARVTLFAEPLKGRQAQLSASITNETVVVVPPMPTQDLAVYDCELTVKIVSGGQHRPQRFHLAPHDYRWRDTDEVPGHGRGCVAVERPAGVLRTETLPRFLQTRTDPRSDHVPAPRFADLVADPDTLLLKISEAMRTFEREWEAWIDTVTDADVAAVARADLNAFRNEHARFDLGRDVLGLDAHLARSFKLTNQTFATLTEGAYDTWRLFQIVYLVLHLPALAAREHRGRPDLVSELDHVDVLWFPTGGGKTEAYLGLIVTALFYDRLRGKARGVTAWLKFPLRMLSVQQLARVLRALVVAEDLRKRELGGPGRPFELGYFVGGSNTPNKLQYRTDGWWKGMDAAVRNLAEDPHAFDEHVIVGNCPYCSAANTVGLDLRRAEQRLVHVCRSCERDLPVHMTDEEVFRYLPSVIVSTVDKVTALSWNQEATALARGPRFECPDHGWFSFGTCPVKTCTRTRRQWQQVTDWKDPVPALIVQDEMHLLREDLGTFSSHYEGLLRSLQQNGPSGLPSKILAASATIEGFEAQLSQVYCRTPRRFPSPGWTLAESFYVTVTDEARRMFLGVQPAGPSGRKVETSGIIASELLCGAAELADDLPGTAAQIAARTGIAVDHDTLTGILFNYEVDLAFVNSKAHGAIISEDLDRMNARLDAAGADTVQVRTLTGEVTVPMLAEAIDLIEKASPLSARKDRLRGLIGTSVVSHGVDLARLNTMVMCGLPITTADYIQATARSGRTHVGLVVTVYDNWAAREASSFTHFVSTHRFLERLVEAVPVNRWAYNGVRRTLPGIAVAHLFDLAREQRFETTDEIRKTGSFQKWWNDHAATGAAVALEDRIRDTYRSPVPGVNPAGLEEELQAAAADRWRREQRRMGGFDHDNIQGCFEEPTMTSLRDVDDPVSFSAMPGSSSAFEALYGYGEEGGD